MEILESVKMSKANARRLYKDMPDFRPALEDTFGKDFFNVSVEDRINSLDDALSETGRPSVPDFDCVPEDLRPFFKSTYKCVVIAEALNEGKRFDLYNESEYRHYPYFRNNGSASAFGLSDSFYDYTRSTAGSGSRLQNIDEETAEYSATKFPEIWKGIQLG